MSTLHEHVTTTVNKHLDHILQLFKERKESHEVAFRFIGYPSAPV